MQRLSFVLISIAVAACGASLSDAGRRVTVVEGPWTDRESSVTGSGCTDLGEVKVSAGSSEVKDISNVKSNESKIVSGKSADENALIKLRNKAGDLGATHVHVQDTTKDGERARIEITGRAYRCASAS